MASTDLQHRPSATVLHGLVVPVDRAGLRADYQIAAFDFWCAARGEAEMPPAARLDPLALPRAALPFVVVYAVAGDRPRIEVRLEGTEIGAVFRRSLRGVCIGSVPGAEAIYERLRWAVRERQPYWTDSRVTFAHDRERRIRVLVLPFGESGVVTRLLSIAALG